eukprot:5370881-Ditylum_brightwellii.AAC.1
MWYYLEGQRYWQKLDELLKAEKLNVKNAEKVNKILINASLYAESKFKSRIVYGGLCCLLQQNSY